MNFGLTKTRNQKLKSSEKNEWNDAMLFLWNMSISSVVCNIAIWPQEKCYRFCIEQKKKLGFALKVPIETHGDIHSFKAPVPQDNTLLIIFLVFFFSPFSLLKENIMASARRYATFKARLKATKIAIHIFILDPRLSIISQHTDNFDYLFADKSLVPKLWLFFLFLPEIRWAQFAMWNIKHWKYPWYLYKIKTVVIMIWLYS